MSLFVVEPRDSLLVRDARPFGGDPGARARSLEFPYPSTLAGGVRTRLGRGPDGVFQSERIAELLALRIRGPFLAQLAEDGSPQRWLMPAPRDAVLFEGSPARLERLLPLRPSAGACSDLPEGLVPLGFLQVISEKPVAGAPRFWFWEAFLDWLRFPKSRRVAPVDLGVPGLEREVRVHVSVSESTRTAKEGALFQTEGLRFTSCPAGSGLSGALRLGLAVDVEGKDLRGIAGLSGFGGERRISAWRPVAKALPEVPAEILDGVLRHRAARLILLTPGCFEAGWRPGALGGATLEAAAVGRPDLVAGWDLHRRRPKPSRRMAPAGSVYFVRLPPEMTSEQMKAWVHSMWMSSLSDSDQDRRDGFGVAAVGVWDGQKAPFPGMGGKA